MFAFPFIPHFRASSQQTRHKQRDNDNTYTSMYIYTGISFIHSFVQHSFIYIFIYSVFLFLLVFPIIEIDQHIICPLITQKS